MELITRKEAKALGLKHYFTGKPCPRGHVDKRFVSINTCIACGRERAMSKHKHTTSKRRSYDNLESFIKAASLAHNNLYTYEKAKYAGAHGKLEITCRVHGSFFQNPSNHVIGKKGCPLCAKEKAGLRTRLTKQAFVKMAKAVWGDRYDYSQVDYERAHKKITIRCKEHGPFEQTPTNHLTGKGGCTKCNHMKSKGELEVLSFLSIFTKTEHRDRNILKPKELDIYLPEHNLAVEYCGEYHHSTKDKDHERETKRNHINKYKQSAAQGVRLITMFEQEWKSRNKQVKRLLRAAVGKLKGRVYARKCEVGDVPTAVAREFFEKYHIQGGSGGGDHYGLYWKGTLVACMRFTFGGNDRGTGAKNRTWTLARYATRVNVVGGASRLFKAFVSRHKPSEVKSFSDNRYYSGGMYEKLGFVVEKELGEDYQVWSPKLGVRPKTHYQRRSLSKRLEEHWVKDDFDYRSDPRTEAEMTYLMGCRRLYDCGKRRWIWTPNT